MKPRLRPFQPLDDAIAADLLLDPARSLIAAVALGQQALVLSEAEQQQRAAQAQQRQMQEQQRHQQEQQRQMQDRQRQQMEQQRQQQQRAQHDRGQMEARNRDGDRRQ